MSHESILWIVFAILVPAVLVLDLGVFQRKAHVAKTREALILTAGYIGLALVFAVVIYFMLGSHQAFTFLTGYIVEWSLSMDNLFVFMLIFSTFCVPQEYQHRVLFWGIVGALVMRGLMIWLGAELIHSYEWVLYIFGLFLVLTGLKMLTTDDTEEVHPERNPVLRLVRRFFPFTTEYDGQRFFTRHHGHRALPPLALVLIMVETTDLVFALDSIPAIFGVTTAPFIVFTSNAFAILGLRSLYFVLAGAVTYFRYLKVGLAIVLVFIGFKMLIVDWVKIPSRWSLTVVATVIIGSILVSIIAERRDRGAKSLSEPAPPRDS